MNCLEFSNKKSRKEEKGKCLHGADGKCINCIESKEKPLYLPFDEFISQRKINCKHPA